MFQTILNDITSNLSNVGIGITIFILSYLSNMCFGLWYNIHDLGEPFEWKKIVQSICKILIVGCGVICLTLAITLIVPFAQENGLSISAEYADVVKIVTILAVCLTASIKYIKEAWTKFYNVLNGVKN